MPFHVDEQQKKSKPFWTHKKSYWSRETLDSLCVGGGTPSDAGWHSLAVLSRTGTSLSWVPNIKQKLFNPLTFIRFLQKCVKSLTVMSQTDSRSITNKWERETMTNKKRGPLVLAEIEMSMSRWILLMAWSMKGEGITHKDTKLVSRLHWL